MSKKVEYLKLNASNMTDSSVVTGGFLNNTGNQVARIELRLPNNLFSHAQKPSTVKAQISKIRLSLKELPDSLIEVDQEVSPTPTNPYLITKGRMTLWPFKPNYEPHTVITPETLVFTPATKQVLHPFLQPDHIRSMMIPNCMLGDDLISVTSSCAKCLSDGYYLFKDVGEISEWFTYNVNLLYRAMIGFRYDGFEMFISQRSFGLRFSTQYPVEQIGDTYPSLLPLPFSRGVIYKQDVTPATGGHTYTLLTSTVDGYGKGVAVYEFSLVVNKAIRDMFSFLPWLEVNNDHLSSAQQITNWNSSNGNDPRFYVLRTDLAHVTVDMIEPLQLYEGTTYLSATHGNIRRILYTFEDIPTVLLNPIQSIVITVNGLNISRQVQPVNIRQVQGSSLNTSIPIAESYIPLAATLADLHDDLVISHETFEDTSVASLSVNDLHERDIVFEAWYILKDGTMRRVELGANGIFYIQLTLGLYY